MPEKLCAIADCIWAEGSRFCDMLEQASIPLDEKWPLAILYLRGIGNIKSLSEIQKSQIQDLLLAVLHAKDYSQTRYDALQADIFSIITLPHREKLDQFVRETSELARDVYTLFGNRRQDVAAIVRDVEAGLSNGNDPVHLLAEIRDTLKDIVAKMEQDSNALVDLSHKDSLTGLANRRRFESFLDECVERWKTAGEPASLIMFDIDHFKTFNDTYGHLVGDQVLRSLSGLVRNLVDPLQDGSSRALAARYGGEEFAVVLGGRVAKKAARIAETLRETIQNANFRLLDGDDTVLAKGLHVTISAGVANIRAAWGDAYQTNLVHCADKALYHAKNNGRNRTARHTPEKAETYSLISRE